MRRGSSPDAMAPGSTVRESLGIGFAGRSYEQFFYAADITGHGRAFDGELHVDLDEADFLALFPLPGPGRARLVGTCAMNGERAETTDFRRCQPPGGPEFSA